MINEYLCYFKKSDTSTNTDTTMNGILFFEKGNGIIEGTGFDTETINSFINWKKIDKRR